MATAIMAAFLFIGTVGVFSAVFNTQSYPPLPLRTDSWFNYRTRQQAQSIQIITHDAILLCITHIYIIFRSLLVWLCTKTHIFEVVEAVYRNPKRLKYAFVPEDKALIW